ncbi:hypothetical protein VWR34_22430, partial [Xanthomonas citri pv. citri]
MASNNFYREFSDNPAPTAAVTALPQMGGSGWVRDLREAMSLGTEAARVLQAKVEAFAAASTRDAQMALLDDVIQAWGATASQPSRRSDETISGWGRIAVPLLQPSAREDEKVEWVRKFESAYGAALDAKGYDWR